MYKALWPTWSGKRTRGHISQDQHLKHVAYDIGVPIGTLITSDGGEVVKVGYESDGFGHYVKLVDYEHGLFKYYAHMLTPNVKVGEYLKKGEDDRLLSGNTGNSSGPHIHFEIRDIRTNERIYFDFDREYEMKERDVQKMIDDAKGEIRSSVINEVINVHFVPRATAVNQYHRDVSRSLGWGVKNVDGEYRVLDAKGKIVERIDNPDELALYGFRFEDAK